MKETRPNLYDYLKIVAIFTMIIDHVGYFFAPEIIELRLIGRVAFPIFLFLVGFNQNYKFSPKLAFMATFVWIFESVISFSKGLGAPQLNILFSILFARIFLSAIKKFEKKIDLLILPIFAFLIILLEPSRHFFDYGTVAILVAFWGFLMAKKHKFAHFFGMATMFAHLIFSILVFRFSENLSIILLVIFAVEFLVLCQISRKNPSLKISPKIDKIALAISKNALEIYAIHIILFSIFANFRF